MKEMASVSVASWWIPIPDYAPAAVPWSGTRALMLAVLEDAIESLRSSNSLARADAERWIMSREHRYVFSFAVICETLDLEPSAARRSVMRLLGKTRTRGRLLKRVRSYVRHDWALH